VGPMKNIVFRMAKVASVDTRRKCVVTDTGVFAYDMLVLALGSTTNFFGNREVAEHAMQLKSISQALDIRSDFLQEFEAAVHQRLSKHVQRNLNFVVVGGGPTGVELAGSLAEIKRTVLKHEYREVESDLMQIMLIDSNPRVLQNFSPISSERSLKYLQELGVNVMLNHRVVNYDGHHLRLSNGEEIPTNTVIWAAGVTGAAIPGLENALDPRSNRYRVNEFCQLEGYPDVYALGDIALMHADPAWPKGHPQVATVAIQQGRYLVKMLVDRAKGVEPAPFRYKHKGSMATIGRARAVVDIGKRSIGGTLAWLMWMFVHVIQLVGFKNRMVVLFNWGWKYLSWKNTIRLIIRPYVRKHAAVGTKPVMAEK
jgi:NADH:ubiquinone reductase (H+-translocating)